MKFGQTNGFIFFFQSGIAYKFVMYIYSTIYILSLFVQFFLCVSNLIVICQRFAVQLLFEKPSHEVCQCELPVNCRFLWWYELWQWSINIISISWVKENCQWDSWFMVSVGQYSVLCTFVFFIRYNLKKQDFRSKLEE